jgi:acylaminoacyl-peptidase
MDKMSDERCSQIWLIDFDGRNHRPLSPDGLNATAPRWSPRGDRLLYLESDDEIKHLIVAAPGSSGDVRIGPLEGEPTAFSWSPSGDRIAFAMRVPQKRQAIAQLPTGSEESDWAEPPTVIESLVYRADGQGYLDSGYFQLFVVASQGGAPDQITSGGFHYYDSRTHDPGPGPVWTPDGESLLFSANLNDDWRLDPLNYDLHELSIETGALRQLTDRQGPETHPSISPDGSKIAYLGFEDRYQGYQVVDLSIMSYEGSSHQVVSKSFDRDVQSPRWDADGAGLFFSFETEGNGKLAHIDLEGSVETLANNLGGLSLGRPYNGGEFDVSRNDRYVFTMTTPYHPSDLAVGSRDETADPSRVTHLSEALLSGKDLARVEEIWFESSFDGRKIQGWIAKPPGFDANTKYPLVLEIHGGPFLNYGDRFAAEVQLFAAAGYVVLYLNPRGSTSYGEEFGNLIHHNYPGQDYDDLMSGIDAVIEKGLVDEDQLFVTGGSGGGVLTAWIVGKTDRFRAAVSAKPVINWYSFALTADSYNFFYKYWFPGAPWEVPEQYYQRSPISLVGNVKTPTMLLTGEEDYRTPMSESEQFYQALKLRQIDTALVRIPGASHSIAKRPSQLIAKVNFILGWFDRYRN